MPENCTIGFAYLILDAHVILFTEISSIKVECEEGAISFLRQKAGRFAAKPKMMALYRIQLVN